MFIISELQEEINHLQQAVDQAQAHYKEKEQRLNFHGFISQLVREQERNRELVEKIKYFVHLLDQNDIEHLLFDHKYV